MKKHTDFVFDREGNAVVGAEVYVRKQSDNTLVQLYSDDGVTAQANPTVTDNDGEWSYFADNNTLKFQVYVDAVQQNEIPHHQHYDLSVVTTFGWSLIDDADAAAARATLEIEVGTDVQAYDAGLAALAAFNTNGILVQTADNTFAGRTLTAGTGIAVTNGTGVSGNPTVAIDEATAANIRANTADKVITTDAMWAAAAFVALAESGGNVAVDLNSGINFTLAMTGNWTLSNPTNGKAGQQGVVEITQDGTGSRTLAYGANWKFAGGTDPVLSTAASAKDLLYYEVLSDGSSVYANLVKAIA